jgi:hypothetical protein
LPRASGGATLAIHGESKKVLRGIQMAITLEKATQEKATSCPESDLPETIIEFVHKGIQQMSEKELRAWKKRSEKIMRKARDAAAKRERSATPVDALSGAGRML